jgi:hypothetical protein
MKGHEKFLWQATPKFFDSTMFRAVRGAILEKLQKIIPGTKSKLHAIFSTGFISLHQGLIGKKDEQN